MSLFGVMVVSDVPLMREGVARVVDRMPDARLVATVGVVSAALDHLRHRPVDVVVVDTPMDPTFAAVRRLSRGFSVFALVPPYVDGAAEAAAGAGATGVALRTAPLRTLAEALRQTARSVPFDATAPTPGEVRTVLAVSGPGGVLSPRESEILQLMAEGLPNRLIAERLVLSVDTIRTHAKNLARKLGVHHRAQAIAFAYRSGFMRQSAS